MVGQYWQPWADLISTLETGKPAFDQVFGTNVFDWRREHAEQGSLFDSYLAKEALAQADDIIAALDFSGVETVAEIGGGYGGLLAAILQAHPASQRPLVRAAARHRGAEVVLAGLKARPIASNSSVAICLPRSRSRPTSIC